jgi:hypothetical protein
MKGLLMPPRTCNPSLSWETDPGCGGVRVNPISNSVRCVLLMVDVCRIHRVSLFAILPALDPEFVERRSIWFSAFWSSFVRLGILMSWFHFLRE